MAIPIPNIPVTISLIVTGIDAVDFGLKLVLELLTVSSPGGSSLVGLLTLVVLVLAQGPGLVVAWIHADRDRLG